MNRWLANQGIGEVQMFKTLSFEDTVKLFEKWGFQVEPGPRPDEVALILEGSDYHTYSVYEARMLPQIAAVAMQVRWQNSPMALRTRQDRMDTLETIPLPFGVTSMLRS